MNIAILCVSALVATLITWLYLSNRKETLATCDIANTDEVTEEQHEQPIAVSPSSDKPKKALLKIPTGKRLAFLIVMFVCLCIMSVSLELVYSKNTLLDNLRLLTLLSLLFVAANVDARERIIPNVLVLTGIFLRVLFWVAELIAAPDTFLSVIKNDLVACLLVIVFFLVGVLLVKGGLGMGDIKLMLVMCLFQGFYGVVSALFFSLFVSFIYAIVVLIAKKKTRKDSVAFAPAILLGTLISVFLTGM